MNKDLYDPLDVSVVLTATKGLSVEQSAVVSIYESLQGESEWSYTGIWGALYFGKDLMNNVFSLKLINVETNQVTWSHECYEQFQFEQLNDNFISFESDDRVVGINIALNSKTSTSKFCSFVNNRLTNVVSASPTTTTCPPVFHETVNKQSNEKPKNALPPASSPRVSETKKSVEPQEKGGVFGFFKKFLKKEEVKEEPVDNRPSRQNFKMGSVKNFQNTAHVGINHETGQFEAHGLPSEYLELLGGMGVQADDPRTQERLQKLMHKYEKKVAKQRQKANEDDHPVDDDSRTTPSNGETKLPPPPVVKSPPPFNQSVNQSDLPPLPASKDVPPPPLNSGSEYGREENNPPPFSMGVPPPPPMDKVSIPPPPPILNTPTGQSFNFPPPPPVFVREENNPPPFSMGVPPPPPMNVSNGCIPPPPPLSSISPLPPISSNNPIKIEPKPKLTSPPVSKPPLPSKPADFLSEIKTFSKDNLKNPPPPVTDFTQQEKEGFKSYLMKKFSNTGLHDDSDSDDDDDDEW